MTFAPRPGDDNLPMRGRVGKAASNRESSGPPMRGAAMAHVDRRVLRGGLMAAALLRRGLAWLLIEPPDEVRSALRPWAAC